MREPRFVEYAALLLTAAVRYAAGTPAPLGCRPATACLSAGAWFALTRWIAGLQPHRRCLPGAHRPLIPGAEESADERNQCHASPDERVVLHGDEEESVVVAPRLCDCSRFA